MILLACLDGITDALERASTTNAADKGTTLPVIVGAAMLLGPLGGLLRLYIGAWLLKVTGRWLGGVANSEQLRTALAWGSVPQVAGLVLWVLFLLLFGEEMFRENTPRLDQLPWGLPALIGLTGVEVVLQVWALILLSNTVAEAQGFRSAWRAVLNSILTVLVIFVPLLLIVAVVAGIYAVSK